MAAPVGCTPRVLCDWALENWSLILRLVACLKYGITFGRLNRHASLNDRRLRRNSKFPRGLERTPDVWVFRTAVESNQPHAMRALHLRAVTESRCPLAEGPSALGTQNFNSVGHESFLPFLIGEDHANPLFLAPDDMAILTFTAAHDVQRNFVRNTNRDRHVKRRPDWGYIADGAIDAVAVELNRSGFKNALPRLCTALFHAAASKAKVQGPDERQQEN
jgi:hypothetical protein